MGIQFSQVKGLGKGTVIGCLAIVAIGAVALPPAMVQAQTPPPPAAAAVQYRVIVDANDLTTLQQVRQVEPTAFLQSFADNRDRIQAGGFNNPTSARERVDALYRVGVRATAYNAQGQPVYQTGTPSQGFNPGNPGGQPISQPPAPPNPNQPQATKRMPRGYYAIVPIDRDQVGVTYEAMKRLGITEDFILVGQELNGWHVAIGVYNNRTAADKMSDFLRRKGGFDARAYFQQ